MLSIAQIYQIELQPTECGGATLWGIRGRITKAGVCLHRVCDHIQYISEGNVHCWNIKMNSW